MNHITVAGHLGADPEVRFTSSGKKVTSFRVGARARRSKEGQDETIWWRVTVWGEQFDNMITYLKKGSPIVVFGELDKPEIFTNRDGKPQVSMNITAYNLSFSPFGRPDSAKVPNQQPAMASHQQSSAPSFGSGEPAYQQNTNSSPFPFSDEEIPF